MYIHISDITMYIDYVRISNKSIKKKKTNGGKKPPEQQKTNKKPGTDSIPKVRSVSWLTSIGKDGQYHSSAEKCWQIPQEGATARHCYGKTLMSKV